MALLRTAHTPRSGARAVATWMVSLAVVALFTVPVMAAGSDRAAAPDPMIHADRPYAVSFEPRSARFVRLDIERTSRGEPCIDELEIYAEDGEANLALASRGALAAASSCLPGYAIHRIEHLNDGRYGNAASWIAARGANEWVQVELPQAADVSRVVISRDREGNHHDRVPIAFSIRVSPDGVNWEAVRTVRARAAAGSRGQPGYSGPYRLPSQPDWDALLAYAFECERSTWQRIKPEDPLSPLQADRPAIPGGPPYWQRIAQLDPLTRALVQMEEMAERLAAKGLDVSGPRRQLAELRSKSEALAAAPESPLEHHNALYHEVRRAKRQLMLRDPDLDSLQRILFVKRHPYHASHNYSDILDAEFRPGGGVCVLELPRRDGQLDPAAGTVTMLFDASDGIARDAAVDFSGKRVYFAYRPDSSSVPGWEPYWQLMSIAADGRDARQLTAGPFHDFYPCPLPDGGLAFVSTRAQARFLCWRPQAFVLFRLEADGSGMRPLSHSNLSEWTPSVARDGRILWTRSEYLDKGADFGHTLWAIRPDGTHPELVFGNNTPHCYINGREVPGTREICCTLFSHGGDHNGPIGLIDTSRAADDIAAVTSMTPDVRPHFNMSWPRYECFRDPLPIARDYFLVSHAPADHFGLYVIDRYGNRELLYLDPEIGSMCPTPLRASIIPPPIPDVRSKRDDEGTAQLLLVDVYRGLEPQLKRGQVKYLRVCEEVRAELIRLPDGQCQADHEPFQDWYATPIHKVYGPHGWPSYVAKASHGLVSVDEHGSAAFEVPAGKVLYFQVLDKDLNELQRMRSVVQLQAGERRGCIGCHEDRRTAPATQPRLADFSPVQLAPPPWGAGPFSYERAVQPVWDAHCVRCHDAKDERGIDLTGKLDGDKVPASYRTLIAGGWVHHFDYTYRLRHEKAQPMTFGTLQSRLPALLGQEHYGVNLTEDERHAVTCWIDLNCPLWPDYQFRPERRAEPLPLADR